MTNLTILAKGAPVDGTLLIQQEGDTMSILSTAILAAPIQGSLSALAVFMLINSITPGPNNLMLLHGGMARGFWQCRWHIVGITLGLGIMLVCGYWGMATLMTGTDTAMQVIKVAGTVYLLWLTYHMYQSDLSTEVDSAADTSADTQTSKLPLSFTQAILFQWLNPKSWIMAVIAPSLAYITINSAMGTSANTLLIILCMLINIACISVWAISGQSLRRLLHNQQLAHVLNLVIVLLTLYCAICLWL